MSKSILAIFAALTVTSAVFASAPELTGVTMETSGERIRPESVYTFTLANEPGVVTFHVETNGVPMDIGYLNFVYESGECLNKVIQPGTYTFRWRADVDAPGVWITTNNCRVVLKAWSVKAPPDYAIYNLKTPSESPRYYRTAKDIPDGVTAHKYKCDYLVMRLIHARGNTFIRGTKWDDGFYQDMTSPAPISFTKDFYIGVYEFTRGQYELVVPTGTRLYTAFNNTYNAYVKADPTSLKTTTFKTLMDEYFGADEWKLERSACMIQQRYYMCGNGIQYVYPNAGITVQDGLFFAKLRTHTRTSTFFLPTSYQWEYACRAGTEQRYSNNYTNCYDLAWTKENSLEDPNFYYDDTYTTDLRALPHQVGLKQPNPWGLYDMHGNAAEMVCDVESVPQVKADGTPYVDPTGPNASSEAPWHYPRGGAYWREAKYCESGALGVAISGYGDSVLKYLHGEGSLQLGFRVVCEAEAVE